MDFFLGTIPTPPAPLPVSQGGATALRNGRARPVSWSNGLPYIFRAIHKIESLER